MQIALLAPTPRLRSQLMSQLSDAKLDAVPTTDAEALLSWVAAGTAGAVVLEMDPVDASEGLRLLSECRALDPRLALFVLSHHDNTAEAVDAMHRGATDVLTVDRTARLPALCRHAARRRLETVVARQASEEDGEFPLTVDGRASIRDTFRGNHPDVAKLRRALLRLARVSTDVLLNGATGCGKEVAARCLHDFGPHAGRPFVAINCGAIPETIFESELFGHEPGAFTGAVRRRIGKLEFAAGGTVFLDEIESMPMSMQVKLLRALQQRSIERVGGNEAVRLNCRIVAATKEDLLALSRAGKFRLDLYYRINVVELHLPSLRDRREDIPMLADTFARDAAQRHGLTHAALDIDFVCGLMTQHWPGNVRELRNAVERHVLGMTCLDETAAPSKALPQLVSDFERSVIEECLRRCQGSVNRAAAALRVPRKTLYDKLARLCVDPSLFRVEPAASLDDAGTMDGCALVL
jgi:DNA-binding NtrC family response regulator